MQINTSKAIRELKELKTAVLADGKVDWVETDSLLKAIRPLAEKHGFLFEDYEKLIEKCREDGKITPEESRKLAKELDFLCAFFSNMRLKFWLMVVSILLAALIIGLLGQWMTKAGGDIYTMVETRSLSNPR